MSYYSNALPIKQKLDALEAVGGIQKTRTQSDKIGFDWDNYYVNDILVKQVYVEQDYPLGTADYPIKYFEGVELINNAYYLVDGVRKVWMGGEFVEF